jgi:hemolysin D
MKIDRQWITLTPGMEVSVEVRTGERRVIGYFLEPLIAGVQGSLHER